MKKWHEVLADVLGGLFAKDQLSRAGARPEAVNAALTARIDLPSFGSIQQPPKGVMESRDLAHCDPVLQRRYRDFKFAYESVTGRQLFETCTWRSPERQFEYFKVGRKQENGIWIVVDKRVIKTNCDGNVKKSKHNRYPSEAIDVCIDLDPGPGKHLSWDRSHYAQFSQLAKVHGLRWGGDWNGNGRTDDERFVDMPHLEIVT